MLVLDEPTNNLDIRSMEILSGVMRQYTGSILLITHDDKFAADIGIRESICL
ncbi:MAG: hypothetical protein LUE10_03805 [Alistipes sp.]|nr:hypothetical protein [Alistipes sp.]